MKALRSYSIYSLILLLLLSLEIQSQVSSFKHFGLDKSIFPSRIECVSQSSSGELLVGTLAGLVIYDGYSFRTLGVADGLTESSISSILVHGDEIVLGHWAGNLTKFYLEKDSVAQIAISSELNFSSVRQTLQLDNGILLILTEEGRLFSYENGIVERVLLPLNYAKESVVQLIHKDETLYLLLESQILSSNLSLNSFSWQKHFSSGEQKITSGAIIADDFWILGTQSGAYSFDFSNDSQDNFRIYQNTEGKSIRSINPLSENEVWIATNEEGVIALELSSGKATRYTRENGLSYNQVRDVFIDREGTVWVGTSAGLDQYLGEAFTLYDDKKGLNGGLVWDLIRIKNYLYALTPAGVSKCIISNDGKLIEAQKHYDLDGNEPRQIIYDGEDLLYVLDASGSIWKGSYSEDKFFKIDQLNYSIKCMEIVKGELWVGTDDGIIVLDDNEAVEHLTTEVGLGGDRITGIYYSAKKDETWITALGGETTLYSEGKFKKFGSDQGLTSSVIQDAAFDPDGNVWFASYDKGVFRKDGDGFTSISDNVTLTSNTSFAIAIDGDGLVWIGHNWGVDRYDPIKNELLWFGEDEGFMGVEVNSGSMIIDESSTIWLGTLMGVLRFDPKKIVKNDIACILNIQRASLGTKDLLNNKPSVVVNSTNDLTVEFKGISLQNPGKNKFLYRLKGAHENWRSLSSNQPIEYLSLPIGDFVFELKAFNNSGVCTDEPLTFEFSIAPPFYKTWWFYTILFILIVALVAYMDRYRVVNLLEQKRALEEKLAIKNQDIIEIDQERKTASSLLKAEEKMVKSLEKRSKERVQLQTEMFNHFSAYGLNNSEIGSHGIISVSCRDYRLILFTDVGLDGIAAHALRSCIKNEIWERIPRDFNPEEILREVTIVLSSMQKSFEKFKGINWLLCIDDFNERIYYKSKMSVFTFSNGLVEEVGSEFDVNSPDNKGLKIASSSSVFVCSQSMFEQLNESGTKPYLKARIIQILKTKSVEKQHIIANEILTDFEAWRGGMDLFNDIEFYIWNHE